MALLDGYFSQQTYGGNAGGLLDMLRMAQQTQQPSAGFPDSSYTMGNVQVPVFGQPEMTGQATLPPNAQPTQGQLPQQMTPQQPGLGDRLSAGFQGFAEGGGLLPALAGAAQGFSSGITPQNQTVKALIASGLDPALAQTIAKDKTLLRAVLPQIMGTSGQTSDIREYEYAKKQGFNGTLAEWMQRKRSGAGEYGMTPIYGTGPDGKPVILQLGKSGEAVASKLPEGVNISTGVEKVDLGTRWGLIDKRSGQVVGYEPKDIVGKESAEETGKAQGLARAGLPAAKTAVESAVGVINELRNHPGIDIGTGLSSVADPRSWIPGQAGYDFHQKNVQAQGKAFLVAREALKGAGQVTDFEGKKGEQAIANLNTAQSKEQYLKALDELERMLQASYADLQKKAGVIVNQPTQAPAPSSSIDDLVKKYSK